MLLSARSQLYLTTTLLLLAILFYISIYFSTISHSLLGSSSRFGDAGSTASPPPNLAYVLNPDEHAYREPKTIRYVWNVTSDLRTPDGVTKNIYLINGHFPGPLIEARSGDEIVVEVKNRLDEEGTAIHWHGLSMQGVNEMDGVVEVTQCAIAPGQHFTYKFKIQDDQAGTFWYHAHSDVQRADGLYGALVVHKPAVSGSSEKAIFEYDEDLALMIGDWYHRSAQEVQDYYTEATNFGLEPAPDSIVINGQGAFNCSMEIPARPIECKNAEMQQLRLSGEFTRLRIINTGALAGFALSISGHIMTLFQVDGGNEIEAAPEAKAIGILYPGERIDVIVERIGPEEVKDPMLTITLDRENLKFKNFALTPTQNFPISSSLKPKKQARRSDEEEDELLPFFPLANASGPTITTPSTANKTILLYTKIEMLSEFHNIPKGFINRTSWEARADKTPLLALERSSWGEAFVPWIGPEMGMWVDIVLNNMDDRGHPFHLHGNSFYVLATHKATPSSYDAYNPFENPIPAGGPLNTLDPLMKDTVFVPRMGYVVLRFRADNEGLWFFHCHILMHQKVGMAMAFQVGGDEGGIKGYGGSAMGLCGRRES
ncbi:L-ascorbate oxidase [Lachnellula arida]|uniref:L-ascorbate oxidase n=1 Tax=Lachnellula arida TaxID=1316785 RepID=A0A8T9B075_9HELO|nr:L-ascorbate oxidase [Lachnellula arida]